MKDRDTVRPDIGELREILAKIAADVGGTMEFTFVPKPVAGSELRSDGTPFPYVVHVDDLWNWNDPSHTYVHGGFETAADALAACCDIVDAFVDRMWQPGMSVEKALELFQRNGFDPWVVSSSEQVSFDSEGRVEERTRARIAEHEGD